MPRSLVVSILIVFLFSAIFSPIAFATTDQEKRELDFSREYPLSFFIVYQELFNPEQFPLLGKLLTVFLKEKDRGFIFLPRENNSFSVESARTIQPGSNLTLLEWSDRNFSFSAELFLEKIISFPCSVDANIQYSKKESTILAHAKIFYSLPPGIELTNQLIKTIFGENYIKNELQEFLEELHKIHEILENLCPKSWFEIAEKAEDLDTVLPITITPGEKKLVGEIIKKIGEKGENNP